MDFISKLLKSYLTCRKQRIQINNISNCQTTNGLLKLDIEDQITSLANDTVVIVKGTAWNDILDKQFLM